MNAFGDNGDELYSRNALGLGIIFHVLGPNQEVEMLQ